MEIGAIFDLHRRERKPVRDFIMILTSCALPLKTRDKHIEEMSSRSTRATHVWEYLFFSKKRSPKSNYTLHSYSKPKPSRIVNSVANQFNVYRATKIITSLTTTADMEMAGSLCMIHTSFIPVSLFPQNVSFIRLSLLQTYTTLRSKIKFIFSYNTYSNG